ncbi:hypothetical protein B1R32_12524 [Abditibacterium utsteinense]|uniref:histidine kinase n=1 Tax=Abditibacterium utsteinense TaxID=1960156 RepID=A0A2S8SPE9_9BACT|nr:PAS domain S-box protein [Abditibacterium utsteinense]PQV62675.1 hypothetical protein B1R32_12524 [Abditibacterium utsteinense]
MITDIPEITASEMAIEELRISENRYRRLFESARDGILILDAVAHKITDVNPFMVELLGYARDEFLGKELWELGLLKDEEASREAFRELEASGYIRYEDLPLQTKAGQRREVEFVSNVYAENGHEVIQCNIRDNTQRKRAEQAEHESKRFLQSTLDALTSHIAVLDETGKIIAANKAWRQFSAENQSTAASCGVGASYLEVCEEASGLWAEEAPSVARSIREIITGERQEYYLEYPYHSPKEERWFNVRVTRFEAEGPIRVVIAHENITARKQAEDLVVISEANLAKAQQVAHLGSWEKDLSKVSDLQSFMATPLRWSDEVYRIFGFQPGEIEIDYEKFLLAVHPGDREFINASVSQALLEGLRNGQFYSFEHRILLPDGSGRIIYEQAEIVCDERTGIPQKMVGTVEDITQRKGAEQQLRESEQRFQSIVANVPGMVYQFARQPDGSSHWPFVGQGFQEIFEEQPEILASDACWPMNQIHPDHRGEFDHTAAISKEMLLPGSWEGRLRLASGKIKWIQVISRPQQLPDGGVLWNGLVMEITARKEAEEERDRFFTMSLDMLAIIGSDGYMKRLNPAFEETLGISNAELMAVPFLDWVHPDDHAATLAQVARLKGGELVVNFQNRYLCRDGSYKWLRWVCAPFEDLWYCVAHDITKIKRAEAALHKSNDELELHVIERTAELSLSNEKLQLEMVDHQRAKAAADAANAAKSEFLSRMSHELRTPLNAILGFGQILGKENLTALQQESVGYILKGGRHLLDLINEVLDIASVESGRNDLSIGPVALDDVVSEACSLMRPLAAQRSIRLDTDFSAVERCHVLADRQRLQQVILNLLSNAIKYNHDGGQVRVACHPMPGEQIRIEVRDTGPGISAADLSKLFTPFERLNAANSGVEGTGLGLTLSQRLIAAMGGRLGVKSVVAQGSTFSIELAQATAPQQKLEKQKLEKQKLENSIPAEVDIEERKAAKRQYTVLCIEDNSSNLRLLEIVLESRREVTMLSAMQGEIGLNLARQHEPDLILLDLHLPDISGQEVLTRLKQSAITRDIPVIVVSADATPPQIQRLMDAGALTYLTKPLNVAEFLQILDQVLRAPEAHDTKLHDEGIGN